MNPILFRCLSLLLIVGTISFGVGCGEDEIAQEAEEEIFRIKTEESKTQSLASEIITAALIETREWQSLYFDSGGSVRDIRVHEGSQVKKGEILARLDSESQSLNVAKAELNLEMAELDVKQAEHKLAQTEALLETGGATQENIYDRQQRLLEAQNKVRQAELNLTTQRVNVENMVLRAPFAGTINEMNIRVGDLVRGDVADPDKDMNRRPPMVMIQPKSGMEIMAQIPEGRASQIHAGIEARVTLMEHRDVVMKGTVKRVGGTVDRDNRTVHVTIAVEAPGGQYPDVVKDGATTLITFLTDVRTDAVTVSERALFYFQNKVYVFQVKGGTSVTRLPVKIGVMRSGRVEITSGLSAGVEIARSHLYLLRDGQTIERLLRDNDGEDSP